jgi:hypothetical protein
MTHPATGISRAVVVLGMHRSGTSVLTRALGAVGVDLGEKLMPGLPDNPKGFFEHLDVTAVNQDLLAELGCTWDSLRLPSWRILKHERQIWHVTRAVALIRERFGNSPLWGFKDPRVNRLWSFWGEVLSQAGVCPVFVMANRHPLSVAGSLARRNRMPKGLALALWALHQVAALDILGRHGGMVVSYDQIIDLPLAQIRRIQRFLGIDPSPETPEIQDFVQGFLEQDLRHNWHEADGSDLLLGSLAQICRDIYLHLKLWESTDGITSEIIQNEAIDIVNRVTEYFHQQQDWIDTVDAIKMQAQEIEWWRDKLWGENYHLENLYHQSLQEIETLRNRHLKAQSDVLKLSIKAFG